MSRSIFITGASSGLGKATAKLFAQHGWKVIATMRKPENEDELDKVDGITLLPLDVTNPGQVQSTSQEAIALGPIDVVFNNAGYGLAGPFEGATAEQLFRQIDTNLLGVMRVTQAFLPHFREQRNGLFITTTSIGGHLALPFNSVYHATKWGLEGWSESLAMELQAFGIGIKTVAPGGIATDFAGRSLTMTQHADYQDQVDKIMQVFMDPERQQSYSTAEQIAAVVYEAATDGKDQLRYLAGEDAKAMYARRQEIGAEAARKEIRTSFLA